MTIQKKKRQHSNTTKNWAHLRDQIGLFFKVFILILLVTSFSIFILFYSKYGHTISRMQSEAKTLVWTSDLSTFRQFGTSMFFDVKGKLISSLSGERELYYIDYEDIPSTVVDAAVTIEDKHFFEHEGVDYIANIRAAVALIRNKGKVTQGASTITQQLARNIFLTNEVTVERKLKEIFIASELEKKYSKKQILEFYLNNIYYANGYYGIQAAAKGYFNKSISSLTLSEVAFLSAIPNSPNLFNPVTNIENTYKRRDKILCQMYEDGLINEAEYKSAKRERITLIKQSEQMHNYVETYVYDCTIKELMRNAGFIFLDSFESDEIKEAYDRAYQEMYAECQSSLYTGGYRVYTSIDLSKQEKLQQAVDEKLEKFTEVSENGVFALQGSAVCIDNETGLVSAIVGGRSQEFKTYTLNRAYQSFRQPGSAIKPLIVYLPYFEEGHKPSETVVDERTEDGPKNSNGVYSGTIDIRTAVEQSKNTVAWNVFRDLTPKKGLSYLSQMQFKGLSYKDEVLAASLGGFTYGTSALEMASAYSTIENEGIYRRPTCIIQIRNATGELVVQPKQDMKRIYDSEASLIMTDVLKGVMTKGTGKELALSGIESAGKTGTTTNKKDGWFVGYTPYYTTSVWVGYDYPKEMRDLYGNTYPGYIWKVFMEEIHSELEKKEFPEYKETLEEGIEESEEANEVIEDESMNEEDGNELEDSQGLNQPPSDMITSNPNDEEETSTDDEEEEEQEEGDTTDWEDEEDMDDSEDEENESDSESDEEDETGENEDERPGEDSSYENEEEYDYGLE